MIKALVIVLATLALTMANVIVQGTPQVLDKYVNTGKRVAKVPPMPVRR